jgi:hypothetical protein
MAKAKPSTALVKWDEKLAALAAAATKTVASVGGGGNFLSLKSGILSYQKAPIPDNKMACIILAQTLENQFYADDFVEGQPASPACYAFGDDRKTMVPHEQVENPVNPTCAGCPNKEWGTASRGKGKACNDVIRLALVTQGDLEDLAAAELAYLKLPYFSTLDWAGYVRQLDEAHHKPPMAFVTELSVVPDAKSQFRVRFRMVEPIETDNAGMEALFAQQAAAAREIAFPYPKFDDAPAAPPARAARRAPAAPAPQRSVAVRGNGRALAPAAPRKAAIQLPPSGTQAPGGVRVGAARAVRPPKF